VAGDWERIATGGSGAARTIKAGRVFAIDISRAGPHNFLEAAGVGVGAGLFAYFNKLDDSGLSMDEARKALKFLEQVGTPEVHVEFEGGQIDARTQAVNIANGP
jgi:hypothetical protein